MQFKNIKTILAAANLPLTYYQWPEQNAPEPPYLVWYLPGSENFDADDKVYKRVDTLNVELYTKTKDFEKEMAVEAVLDAAGFTWDKTETYIDSEHMYEVLYEMEILIDGQQN